MFNWLLCLYSISTTTWCLTIYWCIPFKFNFKVPPSLHQQKLSLTHDHFLYSSHPSQPASNVVTLHIENLWLDDNSVTHHTLPEQHWVLAMVHAKECWELSPHASLPARWSNMCTIISYKWHFMALCMLVIQAFVMVNRWLCFYFNLCFYLFPLMSMDLSHLLATNPWSTPQLHH